MLSNEHERQIIVQSTIDEHLAGMYVYLWDPPTSMVTSVLMSPYLIALCLGVGALFGTANQAMVPMLVSSVHFWYIGCVIMYKLINTLKTQDDAIPTMMDYGPSAELGDVSSKYSCLPITLYIERVGQVMQTQEGVQLAEVHQYMTMSWIMQLQYVWQQCLVSGAVRMAPRLVVLKFHASVFWSISGINMVLGNSVKIHWLIVDGENAANRLNVKISLSMFESVIWVTSEKWSTLPELEVGQSCPVDMTDNNWILWPTGQIHQSLRGWWHNDKWITSMFYHHTCSLNLYDNVLACPTLVWTR